MLKNAEYRVKFEREDIVPILQELQGSTGSSTGSGTGGQLELLRFEYFQPQYEQLISSNPNTNPNPNTTGTIYDEIEYYMSVKCSLVELYQISLGNVESLSNGNGNGNGSTNDNAMESLLQSIQHKITTSLNTNTNTNGNTNSNPNLVLDFIIYKSTIILDVIMADIAPLL